MHSKVAKVVTYPKITNKFMPYEKQFMMIGTVTTDGSSADQVTKITVKTVTQQFTHRLAVSSETYNFSLDHNVYIELVKHYSEVVLSFPIKRMD